MEIILKQDVKHVGYKNDLVKVKNGYGRNFLIPKGYAMVANDMNKKVLAETLKQTAFKEEKLRKAASETAELLKKLVVKIGAKAGENGKIFGSVNTIQLAEAIKKLGYDVDRKNIAIEEDHIKNLGTYTANVRLHKDITAKFDFEVVEE
jgi:large subunit ribosomal protein L9